METSMKKVVVLGTGTMAVGIAAGFISSGCGVILLGRNIERAKAAVSEVVGLAEGLSSGLSSGQGSSSLDQIQTGTIDDWSDWSDVALVLETVTENLVLKQTIFASLDKRVPIHIPIGSNSSGFPISQISQSLKQLSACSICTTSCQHISCHWLRLSWGKHLIHHWQKKFVSCLRKPARNQYWSIKIYRDF